MQYAGFRAAGLPVGSGVTEAGCKELLKARCCRSGMRWKRASGAPSLQLRAIKPIPTMGQFLVEGHALCCLKVQQDEITPFQSDSPRKSDPPKNPHKSRAREASI